MRASVPLAAALAAACLAAASPAAAEGWEGGSGPVAPERAADRAAPPPLGASLVQLDARMNSMTIAAQEGLLSQAGEADAAARLVAAAVVSPALVEAHAARLEELAGREGLEALRRRATVLRHYPSLLPALSESVRALTEHPSGEGLLRLFDGAAAAAPAFSGEVPVGPDALRRDVERASALFAANSGCADALGRLAASSPGARLIALAAACPQALRDPAARARLDELGGPGMAERLSVEAERLHLPANANSVAELRGQLAPAFASGAFEPARIFDALPAWAFQEPADPGLSQWILALEPAKGAFAVRRRLLELAGAASHDRAARLLVAAAADPDLVHHRGRMELDRLIGPIAREALSRRAAELGTSGMLDRDIFFLNALRRAKKALRRATLKDWRAVSVKTLLSGTEAPRLRAPAEPAALPAPAAAPRLDGRIALGAARSWALDGGEGRRVRAIGIGADGLWAEGARSPELSSRGEGELRIRVVAHPGDPAVIVKIYHDPASLRARERLEEKLERLAPLAAAGAAPRLLEHGEAAVPGAGLAHYYAQERVDGRGLSGIPAAEWPVRALAELLGRLKTARLALEASSREDLLGRVLIAKDTDGRERAYLLDGRTQPASGEALEANQALLSAALDRQPGAEGKPTAPAQATPSATHARLALLQGGAGHVFVAVREGARLETVLSRNELAEERFLQGERRPIDHRREITLDLYLLADFKRLAAVERLRADPDVERVAVDADLRARLVALHPELAHEETRVASGAAAEPAAKAGILEEDAGFLSGFGRRDFRLAREPRVKQP